MKKELYYMGCVKIVNDERGEAVMNKRKSIALLLCVTMSFFMLFSVMFIATEAHHDCTGTECPICQEIQACVNLLNSFVTVGAASVALFTGIICIYICTAVHSTHRNVTLVSLKVKLTD
jgi:K+-transporting ATPase A subunit